MNSKLKLVLAAVGFLLASGPAHALPLDIPVPDNAYITQGGLDWAWAAPCAPNQPSCGVVDLSYQSAFGWRLPTADELLGHPSAIDFVFDGANVPLGGSDANGARFSAGSPGGDAACAAPYFSSRHSHCDWSDGLADRWSGLPHSASYWESLAVRDAKALLVPEPDSLAVVGLGLLVLAVSRRAKR